MRLELVLEARKSQSAVEVNDSHMEVLNGNMELHNKQKEIVRSTARFKIIRAGRRGGKSTLNVEDCCFKAVSENNQNILYLSPTYKQSRSIVWEDFRKRLSPIGAKFNEARLEIQVPTQEGGHSTIFIGGFESRENYRGMKFHHIVFDELDTYRDFFISWQEIFRPALTDTLGTANFIGTPKAESRNLQRLEKVAEVDIDYKSFHFTSYDNPHVDDSEIDKAKKELDPKTFKQEYLAEYVEDAGALFRYSSIVDTFTNTVTKGQKYLTVDIADDGSDKSVFSFWDGLEEYRREEYAGLNTEALVAKIREYAVQEQIPHSHIAVDAIGVGAGVASNSLLDGVIGFKSSYAPIKTDMNIVALPNAGVLPNNNLTSDYRNLRSQCVFTLADLVNTHKIASRVDGQFKEYTIEELQAYQDASKGDGKRFATPKEDIKDMLGRSPDHTDTWLMRMYFVVMERMQPEQSEQASIRREAMLNQMLRNRGNAQANNTR